MVDKDPGVTSHDIVGAIRRLAGTRKVGHAGTLDPMATGVLCVGIGRVTKLLSHITGKRKVYTATVRLGIATSTDDAEGEITQACGSAALGIGTHGDIVYADAEEQACARIDAAMDKLTGDILQVPSSVSAKKINGKRAYDLVRQGKEVELAPVAIHVERFTRQSSLRTVNVDVASELRQVVDIDVLVECSAGTYVRALARDLGKALGVGAHLTSLRRTCVGNWGLEEAHRISDLAAQVASGAILPHLSLAEVCRAVLPTIEVSEEEAEYLRHGGFISSSDVSQWAPGEPVATAFVGQTPVALLSRCGRYFKPDLILTPA